MTLVVSVFGILGCFLIGQSVHVPEAPDHHNAISVSQAPSTVCHLPVSTRGVNIGVSCLSLVL